MDMVTFESLGLQFKIIPFPNQLFGAAGNDMNIIGSTVVNISIKGALVLSRDENSKFQNLQICNSG